MVQTLGCVKCSGRGLMTIPGTLYPVSTVRRRTATVPPTVPLKSEALSRRLGASQIPLFSLMYDGSHSWLHRATARDTLSSIVWRSARRPPRPVVRYGGVRCRVLPEHAVRPCHIVVHWAPRFVPILGGSLYRGWAGGHTKVSRLCNTSKTTQTRQAKQNKQGKT